MQHNEGRFTGADGIELYYRRWLPETGLLGVVALVHGVGEHCGRYMNLVTPLVDAGYAVYGYDQRGHGASPGPRVHIDRWTQYRDDLAAYLKVIAEECPGKPTIIYGHSMGSLVVLDYLLQRPKGLAGAIISGAALAPAGVGSPVQIVMAKTLSGVLPRLSVNLGIDATSLTRDPEAVEAFRADPLVTGRATVRWGAESISTVARIKEGMSGLDIPVLVVHGEADPLNLVEGAHELFDAIPHPDKTIRIYPGVFHEPHNDLDHEQLARDVKEWLAHLTSESA